MEISTAVLALIVASLSLVMSIYTSVTTRRASQLQRLAAIRTKLFTLMCKVNFDLTQYDCCAKKFDQFLDDEETTFEHDISFLKEFKVTIGQLKSRLDSVSSTLSKFPLSLGAGQIDEIEHHVDSCTQSIDIASERLLPKMLNLLTRIESAAGEQRSEVPKS